MIIVFLLNMFIWFGWLVTLIVKPELVINNKTLIGCSLFLNVLLFLGEILKLVK